MDDEQYRSIVIGSYVQGTEVDTGFFARGYLVGYKLMDKTDPKSIAAEIEKDHSHSVFITMDSMKLVSRYETLLKKLEEYGLKYIDGKIIGRPQPKFAIGDIARHKNYSDKAGDVIITYVCEHGYTYRYANCSGGGTFGFSAEKDYNLIKSNNLDFEKKESKKIEQKDNWSEDDDKILKSIIINIENLQFSDDILDNYYITNTNKNYYKIMTDWLKALKERVQAQPKQEWSKEDERILKYIIIRFENLQFSEDMREKYHRIPNENKSYYQIRIDWLKAIKDRVQSQSKGKPSDEQ